MCTVQTNATTKYFWRYFTMKIYEEKNYDEFDFWSGARATVNILTDEEMEMVWQYLEDCYPEGMEATEVNDFFWFEDEIIAGIIGWPDYETLWEARNMSDKEFNNYEEYEEYINSLEEEEEE